MTTIKTDENGTTITNIGEDFRFAFALRSLKGRLTFAISAGRTDAFALHSARGWAEKRGYAGKLTTMKQALRWVEAEIVKSKA